MWIQKKNHITICMWYRLSKTYFQNFWGRAMISLLHSQPNVRKFQCSPWNFTVADAASNFSLCSLLTKWQLSHITPMNISDIFFFFFILHGKNIWNTISLTDTQRKKNYHSCFKPGKLGGRVFRTLRKTDRTEKLSAKKLFFHKEIITGTD